MFHNIYCNSDQYVSLQWSHNGRDGVSNHQPQDCLLNCLFRCKSKKTSKLRVTGLCEGNSPVIGEFPAQRASNSENVSIWWRQHVYVYILINGLCGLNNTPHRTSIISTDSFRTAHVHFLRFVFRGHIINFCFLLLPMDSYLLGNCMIAPVTMK